jgi:hypothetical protein
VHHCKKHREADPADAPSLSIMGAIEDYLPALLRSTLQTVDATQAKRDKTIKVLKLWAAREIFTPESVAQIEADATDTEPNADQVRQTQPWLGWHKWRVNTMFRLSSVSQPSLRSGIAWPRRRWSAGTLR